MKVSAKSLANLVPQTIPFTSETARIAGAKGLATRQRQKELRDKFKESAIAFMDAKSHMPNISGVEVLRLCMHMALNDKNYEDAARWADKVAEYEQPKLQRIDKTLTTKVVDLTDEELRKIIENEGLEI